VNSQTLSYAIYYRFHAGIVDANLDITKSSVKEGGIQMVVVGAERRRMVVALPLGSEAVADMLIALGEAGIEVSQLGRSADDNGAFSLTVNGSPHLAGSILESIGCTVIRQQAL
jgi:hypothetical protein